MNPAGKSGRRKKVNPVRVAIGYTIGMLMVLAGIYFASLTPVGPLPQALTYLESNDRVEVSKGDYTFFMPQNNPVRTGFIFYPGGRVDNRSYAPLASGLAKKGWPVAVVPMPLNLAILGQDRASKVIRDHPEIDYWVIGGHSLGGTMAAQFAEKHPDEINGIVFLAAYPQDASFVNSGLPVLSVYGTGDGLIPLPEWLKYRNRFPANTQWVMINGGNHAGFGWYGEQDGDSPASISLEEQTYQVLQAVDQFLLSIENSNGKEQP